VGVGIHPVGIAILAGAIGTTVSRSVIHERIIDLSGDFARGTRRGTHQGLAEGQVKGAVAEAKKFLLLRGSETFGPPNARITAIIERLNDLTQLEELYKQVPTLRNWQELLDQSAPGQRRGRKRERS
jgi:hypothetical protein